MVNGLHLYSAFLTSDHSKRFTICDRSQNPGTQVATFVEMNKEHIFFKMSDFRFFAESDQSWRSHSMFQITVLVSLKVYILCFRNYCIIAL